MMLKITTLNSCIAAIFEKTFSFIWTLDNLIRTIYSKMLFHTTSWYNCTAFVLTRDLVKWTILADMLIHFIENKTKAAIKKALYLTEYALFFHMLLKFFSNKLPTLLIIWTLDILKVTDIKVALNIASFYLCLTVLIWTPN